MNIVILSIGTFGDVYPFIALGSELKKAGYEVCLATHEPYREFVTRAGIDFSGLAGDPTEWARDGQLLSLVEASRDFNHWMQKLRQLANQVIYQILDSCWASCQGADAIIYSPLAWAGYSIAEKMNLKCVTACLQPLTRTSCFAPVWISFRNLGGAGNRLAHVLIEQMYWHFFRPYITNWRGNCLRLNPLPLTGPFGQKRWQDQLFLYAFSPSIVQKPYDWPANAQITGYWFMQNNGFKAEKNLERFIEDGPEPVYIGFGSMPDQDQKYLVNTIFGALELAGTRAVLQMPASGLPLGLLSPQVYHTGWVNHSWLFPKMASVVHHGSATITASSLRAGVPTVAIPYAWDQVFWGRRIAGLQSGPDPILRKNLTSQNLARAIIAATNPSIKLLARRLGKIIGAEDGKSEAVKIINRYLA